MSEEKLLEEIKYLTGLIQAHEKSEKPVVQPVRPSTQRNKSSNVYTWKSVSSHTKATKPVSTAVGLKPHTCISNQSYLRERTRQGNLVYRPGGHVQLNSKTKAEQRTASELSRGRTQSKFVYDRASGKQWSGCLSRTLDIPIGAIGGVKHTQAIQSLSKPDPTSTIPAEESSSALRSDDAPHSAQSIDSIASTDSEPLTSTTAVVKSKKRSTLKSGSWTHTKRPRLSSNNQGASKYVWRAKSKHKISVQSTHQRQLPRVSQLKWRRKSHESAHSRISSAKRSARLSSSLSSPLTSTPFNVRYKWRRRISSSGSRKGLTSPLVAKSRYKMMRASLLHKYRFSRFGSRKRLSSYVPRNIAKSSQWFGQKSKSPKSRNRVWVSGETDGTSAALRSRKSKPNNRTQRQLETVGRQPRAQLVSFEGGKFVMDPSGKRLKRLSSSNYLRHSASVSDMGSATSAKRLLASRAIRRSKAYVWHARQRKEQEKKQQYCKFFNRFGKCNRMDTCPYIHDSDRVALCTKFLRGICDKLDGTCPFSHKTTKGKVPACSFFLRGGCVRDSCPYLHVSVGRDAEVCPEFMKGYCPKGEQCTKQHTLECPDFSKHGSCPRGKACPLRHRISARQKPLVGAGKGPSLSLKEPHAFKKVHSKRKNNNMSVPSVTPDKSHEDSIFITPGQLEFIPLDENADFIGL